MMPRFLPVALAAALAAFPAVADDFTETVESALEAYKESDIKGARQELDFAIKLLDSMKSAELAKLLPEALPGWTRTITEDQEGAGMAMAMFGGGTTATADYTDGSTSMSITLIADSPMVSGLGGMFAGLAGAAGKPVRIKRTQFAVNDGELQGVVENRVMVSVSGDASEEAKVAQVEAMDFDALGRF